MFLRKYKRLAAGAVEGDPTKAAAYLRLLGDAGWRLEFRAGLERGSAPTVTDGMGRNAQGPVMSWQLSGNWLQFVLSEAAQAVLDLPALLSIDLKLVPSHGRGLVEDALRTIVGPSEADLLHAVIVEVFHIDKRGRVLACRHEAGEPVTGQPVEIEATDGRRVRGLVTAVELHNPPGQVGLIVAADDPSVLERGAVIRGRSSQSLAPFSDEMARWKEPSK
jgi:hypothetical protein